MNGNAFYARVRGRVQGVGFRYSAVREAQRLRVNGWVMNAADGAVEIWAEGSPENLETFLVWLQKGPQFSRVDFVDRTDQEPRGYSGFDVKY
ncbi:MAG: acylphosphatase [Treponema sp.]|jgi:acylphosphatase|nr:acylphosphatase [Treponema sp.]